MIMGESTDERKSLVYNTAQDLGVDGAAIKLNIARETVRRYCRKYKQDNNISKSKISENLLRQISEQFSEDELRRLISNSAVDETRKSIRHTFDGEEITFGFITDTHLGSVYTDTEMLFAAFDEFANQNVDFIAHAGDVHEGLSNRPGHYYECTHIGYSQQLEHSREIFGQWTDSPIYMIDGNHDRWYIKTNGALICNELAKSQDNIHFMGHDEGDIDINGVTIKLFHGEDAGSYAFSYRIQKLVEAFTGGEKPEILLCGHAHKAIYVFDRNIHCISGGALQKQSKWMRSKRLASHVGFWIVKMTIGNGSVLSFSPQFYPFYK